MIRIATPADAATLASLGRDTFIETWVHTFAMGYSPEDLAAYLAAQFDPGHIEDLVRASDSQWLLAEVDGDPVAYAYSGPCGLPHPEARREHGELKRLYVRRAHQGTGLGRALLERSLAWLGDRFDGPVWLGVWSGNLKAQKLYGAHGFGKVGEYDYPVGRTLDREFIFRR
ncbi:MAG: GNAT family N-acetyltransferase [Deltaproteobacteria bacterium]